jgi:hypothetical protein
LAADDFRVMTQAGDRRSAVPPEIRQRQRHRGGRLTKLTIRFDKAGEKRVVDSFVERV